MFRVEKYFEMGAACDIAGSPLPFEHYAMTQLVYEVPVWHLRLLRLADGDEAERWEHYVVGRALLVAGLLVSNTWLAAEVKVLLPGYMSKGGQLELFECKSLWKAHETVAPGRNVCVFETELGLHVDSTDGVELCNVTKTDRYWQACQ